MSKLSIKLSRLEVDKSGYDGVFSRNPKKNQAIDWVNFCKLFIDNDLLTKLVRTIKEIDKDRNGYITNQELEDIVSLCYPSLKETNLVSLFKPFADPINNILVDYKKLLRHLKLDINLIKENYARQPDPVVLPLVGLTQSALENFASA